MTEFEEVEFQGEIYKKFSSVVEAEEYRNNLHGDDRMDNKRISRLPFVLEGEIEDENLYEEILNEYHFYLDAKDDGCCGFMDEKIFIGNQMFVIGCNFGH